MTTLNETRHAEGFIISEANGRLSRGSGTLISGQKVTAGEVLGTITASGKYTTLDPDAGTGEQVASAIALNDTDATDADHPIGVLVRFAEINQNELVWGAAVDADAEKTTALGELAATPHFIIARTAQPEV